MSKKLLTLIALFQFFVISPMATAEEIIKCRSRTGQIIYSDISCEKQGASTLGVVDASPNEVGAIKPIPVDPRRSADGVVTNSPELPAQTVSKTRHQDPEERRRRVHELELILNGMVSTPEQKTAARRELSDIASLGVCVLNEDQRKRRDGAYADLGSLVQTRRPPAFAVLRQILSSCQRG